MAAAAKTKAERGNMPTYKQIQATVKQVAGFTPKTCWIADLKEQKGLTTRAAPNRRSATSRGYPCPETKREGILKAFRQLGMI